MFGNQAWKRSIQCKRGVPLPPLLLHKPTVHCCRLFDGSLDDRLNHVKGAQACYFHWQELTSVFFPLLHFLWDLVSICPINRWGNDIIFKHLGLWSLLRLWHGPYWCLAWSIVRADAMGTGATPAVPWKQIFYRLTLTELEGPSSFSWSAKEPQNPQRSSNGDPVEEAQVAGKSAIGCVTWWWLGTLHRWGVFMS